MTRRLPGLESPVPAPKLDIDVPKPVATAPKVTELPVIETKSWNTKNLGLRLASDFVSGASAAIMVAPLITVIDKLVLLHPLITPLIWKT